MKFYLALDDRVGLCTRDEGLREIAKHFMHGVYPVWFESRFELLLWIVGLVFFHLGCHRLGFGGRCCAASIIPRENRLQREV